MFSLCIFLYFSVHVYNVCLCARHHLVAPEDHLIGRQPFLVFAIQIAIKRAAHLKTRAAAAAADPRGGPPIAAAAAADPRGASHFFHRDSNRDCFFFHRDFISRPILLSRFNIAVQSSQNPHGLMQNPRCAPLIKRLHSLIV